MTRIFTSIFFLWMAVSCTDSANKTDISNFDSPESQQQWTLVKDTNSSGNLDLTSGENGQTARITYDVSTGGRWVGAEITNLKVPADAKGIRLKIKCSGTSTAWIYLKDSTGQQFEHRLTRSLTDLDDQQWFSRTISFQTVPDSIRSGNFTSNTQKTLKSLTVVIEPRMDPWYPKLRWFPQPKGEMEFDDVEWITNYDEPLTWNENQESTVSSTNFWEKTGVCTHFEQGDFRLPDSIKSVGFTSIRGDFIWGNVERVKGKYDFRYGDSIVQIAENKNIRTLLILCYSNSLYDLNNHPPKTEEQRKAYSAYCAATVRHYKGRAVDFEIWNEPNLVNFWKPWPNAAQFAPLLRMAIDSMRAANPEATIISGGTAGIDWRYIDSLGVQGALKGLDGLGIHPYRMGSPESFSEDLVCLRQLAKKYFTDYKPEWATEYGAASSNYGNGYADSSQHWQARIDVRAILANWMAGFTYSMKYEFFTMGSDPKDPECHYGMITPELLEKPTYTAIKTLKNMTINRQFSGRLQTQNSGAYALQFDGKDDKVLILWTSAGKIDKDITGYKTSFILPEKPVSVFNFLGKEISVPEKKNGKYTVEAGGEVVYVVFVEK